MTSPASGLLQASLLITIATLTSATPPNIIVIIADDLGWHDVGWRNSYMRSPTIDRMIREGMVLNKTYVSCADCALPVAGWKGMVLNKAMAREGMVLNKTYVQGSCAPSRAALMSGRYAYHVGFQYLSVHPGYRHFLPEDGPILPQTLKSMGYATHMVGKWHLGFCNWRYTPTYRGFDTFYGYYNANEDYYTHTSIKGGYDFRDGEHVDWSAKGTYSTHLFVDRTIKLLEEHDKSKPLFLYLSFQAVHADLMVPKWYMNKFCHHVKNYERRIKCGMIYAMDEGIRNVTEAAQRLGLLDNSFVVFSSDNGGPVGDASSNWPLRGSKKGHWEGSTRAAAFVWSPKYLKRPGTVYEELMHISDWYPTLVEAAADGKTQVLKNLDGVSQWQSLQANKPGAGPRTEFLYNMDDVKNNSALRQGRFKLVQGKGHYDGWHRPAELGKRSEEFRGDYPDYNLFDLEADPQERHCVLAANPDVFNRMKERMAFYHKTLYVRNYNEPYIASADPKRNNGTWSPGYC